MSISRIDSWTVTQVYSLKARTKSIKSNSTNHPICSVCVCLRHEMSWKQETPDLHSVSMGLCYVSPAVTRWITIVKVEVEVYKQETKVPVERFENKWDCDKVKLIRLITCRRCIDHWPPLLRSYPTPSRCAHRLQPRCFPRGITSCRFWFLWAQWNWGETDFKLGSSCFANVKSKESQNRLIDESKESHQACIGHVRPR